MSLVFAVESVVRTIAAVVDIIATMLRSPTLVIDLRVLLCLSVLLGCCSTANRYNGVSRFFFYICIDVSYF